MTSRAIPEKVYIQAVALLNKLDEAHAIEEALRELNQDEAADMAELRDEALRVLKALGEA